MGFLKNLFSAFNREDKFFEKGKFYKLIEKGELDSLEKHINNIEKQKEYSTPSGNPIKIFVKKLIKKIIRY